MRTFATRLLWVLKEAFLNESWSLVLGRGINGGDWPSNEQALSVKIFHVWH